MLIVVILLGKDSYRQEKNELKHLVHGVLSIRIQDVRVLAVDKERPCQIALLSRVSWPISHFSYSSGKKRHGISLDT